MYRTLNSGFKPPTFRQQRRTRQEPCQPSCSKGCGGGAGAGSVRGSGLLVAVGALRPGCLRAATHGALLVGLLAGLRRFHQCCQQAGSQALLWGSGSSVSESAGRILSPCCCGCIRGWGGALCVGGGCCGGGISAAGAHGMCPRWLGPAAACRIGGSTGMMRLAASKQQEWWGNRGR